LSTMPAPTGLPLLALKLMQHSDFDISGITSVANVRAVTISRTKTTPAIAGVPAFYCILIVYCVSGVACFADKVILYSTYSFAEMNLRILC
jgi:hypothetical protein